MFVKYFKPHPLLSEIVNTIVLGYDVFDKTKPLPFALFPPMPDSNWQFYPRDCVIEHKLDNKPPITHGRSIIVPSCTKRINLSLGYDYIVIRIGFHPGGLHRLMHLPMHEVVDKGINA